MPFHCGFLMYNHLHNESNKISIHFRSFLVFFGLSFAILALSLCPAQKEYKKEKKKTKSNKMKRKKTSEISFSNLFNVVQN